MKSIILFILMAFTGLSVVKSQAPIGIPQVTSFRGLDYGAGDQNWGIAQDKNGVLFFANNEGLLTFNGMYWKLYPFPNKTIVRSVKIDQTGRIFVGAQDEIGYYLPNKNGVLMYHSLKPLIPKSNRQFADVWNIEIIGNAVYFRTMTKIFRLINDKINVYDTSLSWFFIGEANKEVFVHEINIGIKTWKDGKWIIRCNDPRITNSAVTAILPYSRDTLLVTTLENGLFLLVGDKLIKKKTTLDKIFYNDRINRAIQINPNLYALGTTSMGLLIVDRNGVLQQQFSHADGLSNNNIRSILLDHHRNLWIGLDNGISFIAFSSAIKHIYPDKNKQIASYASRIFEGKLYIGTSNGLFSASVDLNKSDISTSKANFLEVTNTKGQTWGLTEINNHLLLAKEDGAFDVKGNEAKVLYKDLGTWLYKPMGGGALTEQVITGTYTGLQMLDYKNGEFVNNRSFSSLNEPLRFVVVDKKINCIWASHPYRGIFKMDLSVDGQSIIKTSLLTEKDGLPLALYNYIFALKDKIVAATAEGIYEYDVKKKKFYVSPYFRPIFKKMPLQCLVQDKEGKLWFASDKKIGVVDFKRKSGGQNFSIVEFPELKRNIVSGFENIYPYDDNNIFIGANMGLLHLDYKKYAANMYKPNVILGRVQIIGATDSVLFGGYLTKEKKQKGDLAKLPHKFNSLHFEFGSTLFEQKENIEFSYYLKGFEDTWSAWNSKSEKDYTNLGAGSYIFYVKARNNLGNESIPASYPFTIRPAWYESNVAYMIYFIMFVFLLYLLIKYQEKQHRKVQDRLRQKHQLELERNEQQITKLQKKQLEVEVEFKNKELATTTMHLVQRGKLLSKIGDELLPMVKQTTSQDTADDLKKVIRLLNEAKKLDNDWDQFAIHFDHVHANFLSNLKDRYPNLSPGDLKLCAYLKLNLSSKEIAQLLNITPRAVEVSRYRLRKKLSLTSDVNLFDFLLK
ncbi:Two component regulator propeller [Pedobacter sp. ok626]|uniref:triple tyrosine motif-containing protein n=1 Tax=Pedobacter sp. ok626 TaxID=1761882 RepID=UPI000886D0E5|nr:triple tyrosine motif-containing protein [Pedobacter sp. ok626]SDK73150.1 Two component regulator propeller [Pedobacter sp. ok626]